MMEQAEHLEKLRHLELKRMQDLMYQVLQEQQLYHHNLPLLMN